jgi:hypothetical protein
MRLVDVRPDGIYSIGSACAVGSFSAYTAAHVVEQVKGTLIALPNFGYHIDSSVVNHVRVVRIDKEKDLARLVPNTPDDAFPYWYSRGPVPEAGAEVRGILILPEPSLLAVPSFGTYYGENAERLWSSQEAGPGASGSCILDDQDRVLSIVIATASWGSADASPANLPRATVSVRIPKD